MAVPSRRDRMICNFMKIQRREWLKGVEIPDNNPKNPEDIKNLLDMWVKKKSKSNSEEEQE